MLTVHPAHGIQRQTLAAYTGAAGNLTCATCGSISRLVAPDSLLRLGRGWICNFTLALARKRWHKQHGKEAQCMDRPQEYAIKLAKLPDRIAAIVAKTYSVMGDSFLIPDDEALAMIRYEIEDVDDTVVERNKNKRLARPSKSN